MRRGVRALALGAFVLALAAILCISSCRVDWLMAWAYVGMLGTMLAITALVVPMDRELIEERTKIKEDSKRWDRPIAIILSAFTPAATLVVAGLDTRFGWSPQIPLTLQVAALAIAALGNLLNIWAMMSNKFFSRFVRIQKDRGHTVATGEPYRLVRHPGYARSTVFILATGLALGSLWALIPAGLLVCLLVFRTALEDKTLQEELDGYREYAQRVRYSLLPGIW